MLTTAIRYLEAGGTVPRVAVCRYRPPLAASSVIRRIVEDDVFASYNPIAKYLMRIPITKRVDASAAGSTWGVLPSNSASPMPENGGEIFVIRASQQSQVDKHCTVLTLPGASLAHGALPFIAALLGTDGPTQRRMNVRLYSSVHQGMLSIPLSADPSEMQKAAPDWFEQCSESELKIWIEVPPPRQCTLTLPVSMKRFHYSAHADVDELFRDPSHADSELDEMTNEKSWMESEVPAKASAFFENEVLKDKLRKGLPSTIRHVVWRIITGAAEVLSQESPNYYEVSMEHTFSWPGILREFPDFQPTSFPSFGNPEWSPKTFMLLPSGAIHAKRLLCMLSSVHPDVLYCPLLPALTSLLLLQLDESTAFAALVSLVERSRENRQDTKRGRFLPLSMEDYEEHLCAMQELLRVRVPKAFEAFLKWDVSVTECVHRLYINLFLPTLPITAVLRIMDSYFNEGFKVLDRAVLALMSHLEPTLTHAPGAASILKLFGSFLRLSPADVRVVTVEAFKLHLSRKELKGRAKPETRATLRLPTLVADSGLRSRPAVEGNCTILTTPQDWEQPFVWLAKSMNARKLHLVYSTAEHGWSLQELYRRCFEYAEHTTLMAQRTPSLVLIDTFSTTTPESSPERRILGAFATVMPCAPQRTYVGTDTGFVFTLFPHAEEFRSPRNNGNYFLPELHNVTWGEGPAIRLDDTLQHGTTSTCPTYGSPPLAPGGVFEVIQLELLVVDVW